MWRVLLVILALLIPSHSRAAYTQIQWSWDQGTGASIEGFKVKCGRATGTYTITIVVADPTARSLDLYTATDGKGAWFCTVSAYNSTAESANGNETNFILPVPPMLLTPSP